MTHELIISGMTCNHCRAAVTQALTKVAGVTHVTVDLASGRATIQSTPELPAAELITAVESQGYSAAPPA